MGIAGAFSASAGGISVLGSMALPDAPWLRRKGLPLCTTDSAIVTKPLDVSFTIPAGGLYLPSLGATVPTGSYKGQITRDLAEHVMTVVIVLDRAALDQMKIEDGIVSLHCDITRDYRDGLIGEDWYV